MSLIYRKKYFRYALFNTIGDYFGEIFPFLKRIKNPLMVLPLWFLKSIEWSIYRWYKTPLRRFYGVKSNELIYMITNRCNDRCAKCGIWKNPEPDNERASLAQILKAFDTLSKNLYQFTITGGEPLLFENEIKVIAKHAHKLEVPLFIITNGTLVDEDFLKEYAKYEHVIIFSIDTIKKEKWKEFRGHNHYDTVFDNLLLAKKYLGKKLRVQSVLARETEIDVQEVIDYCKKNSIIHVIQPYFDFGGAWEKSNKISYISNDSVCAARKNICIYPNGDIVKCFDHQRIPLAKKPLGNIKDEDIISILCKKRSTEISRIMKSCNMPCKLMSCNLPPSKLF